MGMRARASRSSSAVAFGLGLVEKVAFLREVAFEQARLLVVRQERIHDPVDLVGRRAGGLQRVVERAPGEAVLQLDAREAFLRGGVE